MITKTICHWIPKALRSRVEDSQHDEDGWWIWLNEHWQDADGSHTIREDTKQEAILALREARKCS